MNDKELKAFYKKHETWTKEQLIEAKVRYQLHLGEKLQELWHTRSQTVKHLQTEVSVWSNKTFGNNKKRISGIFNHLERELTELKQAIRDIDTQAQEPARYHGNIAKELADCQILLFGLADAYNIDLGEATIEKMEENKNRKWKKPDNDGVCEHEQ